MGAITREAALAPPTSQQRVEAEKVGAIWTCGQVVDWKRFAKVTESANRKEFVTCFRNHRCTPIYPQKTLAGHGNSTKRLGLKAKEEYAGGVIYEFGKGTACFLYPTPNAGTSRASQAFWQVEDVEREVAELKARGVVFEEYDMPGVKMQNSIAAAGGAKTAWFKDSEGNILAVSQRL
jgi:hypothetical protein